MSYESADDLKFYISHGYCPDNASKTLEWAFQDWGASRMAARLGKRSEARMFENVHEHGLLYSMRNRVWYFRKREMVNGCIRMD